MNGWMDGRTGKTILSAASGNFQVEKYKSLAVGNRELIPPPQRSKYNHAKHSWMPIFTTGHGVHC